MARTGIVYKATNNITKRAYIGLSKQPIKERIRKHYIDCAKHTYAFANALRKYNKKDWVWEIVYTVPVEQLRMAETCAIYLYDTYHNGYNSTLGGEDNPMNYEQYKQKVSLSKVGKKRSKETLKKMSEANMGKKATKETKEKISKATSGKNNPMYGRTHFYHSRLKMAINSGSKPFLVYKGDNLIGLWINKKECARVLNIDNSSITKCLKGKKRSAGGYIFFYKEMV